MMSLWKRAVALILCFLETTILGGAMFGWPSLVYVLQGDELYIDRCNQSTVVSLAGNATTPSPSFMNPHVTSLTSSTPVSAMGANISHTKVNADSYDVTNGPVTSLTAVRCQEQKVALSLSYTVAAVAFGISALPVGLFFDRFGLRTTRTLTALLAMIGYCQLAFAKPGLEWIMLTGAVFIGPTCYALIITNFHVAKLAGKRISLAITIYAAGMNTSFAYQVVKMAHDAGVSRVVALLVLAALWTVVLLTSWCLLPKDKVDDQVLGIGKYSKNVSPKTNVEDPKSKNAPNVEPLREEKLVPFITSATYITFLFWFCADYACLTMVISAYDPWITEIVDGDLKKVTFYTDFLAYGTLAGSLLTPINGFVTDFMLAKYGCEPGGKSLTILPAAICSSIIMALVNIPLLFHTEAAIFAVGVLFLVGKPLFLSTPAIYMGIVPPMQFYGIVFGILNAAGGGAVLMTYTYVIWAVAAQSFTPVTLLILATSILAFSFPLMLYHDRWTKVRTSNPNLQITT